MGCNVNCKASLACKEHSLQWTNTKGSKVPKARGGGRGGGGEKGGGVPISPATSAPFPLGALSELQQESLQSATP